MATVTVTTCDGTTECQEPVVARADLQARLDSIVSVIAGQDACEDHVGDVVTVLFENRENLLNIWHEKEKPVRGKEHQLHQIVVRFL